MAEIPVGLFHEEPLVQLWRGDCVEVMAQLPAESVEAIVTDPPYGLEFMGKEWDRLQAQGPALAWRRRVKNESDEPEKDWGVFNRVSARGPHLFIAGAEMQAWHERWAREALRLLKPGGHVVIFGGERTYHRMACAVEDAGFEVRTMLVWVTGQGFPKSARVNRDPGFCQCDAPVRSGENTGREQLRQDHIDRDLDASGDARAPSGVPRSSHGAQDSLVGYRPADGSDGGPLLPDEERAQASPPSRADAPRHSRSAGRADDRLGVPVHSLFPVQCTDRPSNRDSEPHDSRAIDGGVRISSSTSPGHTSGSVARTPGMAPDFSRPDYGIGFPRCARCGKPDGDGYGTALKPAATPILLARKPLSEPTVAANVLKHGTGALNIDGSRIGSEAVTTHETRLTSKGYKGGGFGHPDARGNRPAMNETEHLGRWPANFLLSHAPECRLVGTKRVQGVLPREPSGSRQRQSGFHMTDGTGGYADADGLETVEAWACVEGCAVRMLDEQSGELTSGAGVKNPIGREGLGWKCSSNWRDSSSYQENTGGASRFFYTAKADAEDRDSSRHPTVKPVALMKWLITLVTPPGGTIIDPFAGSGTTIFAARALGFKSIGIEREEAYCQDALRRLRQGVLL